MASLRRKLNPEPKPKKKNLPDNARSTFPHWCPTDGRRAPPLRPALAGSSSHFTATPIVYLSPVLGVAFFFAIALVIWKLCLRRNDSARAAEGNWPADDGDGEGGFGGNLQQHPAWLIRTVGLAQSAIDSITVCKFKPGEGLIEGTECSVCLCEFEEDERLRLLPKCSHGFHLPCIDPWLRSHRNCPLCRAPVVVEDARSRDPERVSNDSGAAEETRVENHENRGDSVEIGIESHDETSSPMDSSGSGSGNGGGTAGGDAMSGEAKDPNAELVVAEKKRSRNSRLTGHGLMKSCSWGRRRSLEMGPVSMKRSFSSGRIPSVSRENKRRGSISTLPVHSY